jgi:hypothetical protein
LAAILAGLIVAGAVMLAAAQVVAEVRRGREEEQRSRELSLATLFGPAIASAYIDPTVLLTWQPLAKTLRSRFTAEFAALDAGSGTTFPFSKDFLSSAHARWTADWLTWEKAHDATYKMKALIAQQEQQARGDAGSDAARARIDAVEREKLEMYQRRYEEYVRVAKALQSLIS